MEELSYEEYELECKKREKENEIYLQLFEGDLKEAGLSDKTIKKHYQNVEFYLNTYLLGEEPKEMVEGCYGLEMYFGYFFIRKCMWSSPATIKSTAASLKKFYKCMLKYHKIEEKDYKYLCFNIKESMEDWKKECQKYDEGLY